MTTPRRVNDPDETSEIGVARKTSHEELGNDCGVSIAGVRHWQTSTYGTARPDMDDKLGFLAAGADTPVPIPITHEGQTAP